MTLAEEDNYWLLLAKFLPEENKKANNERISKFTLVIISRTQIIIKYAKTKNNRSGVLNKLSKGTNKDFEDREDSFYSRCSITA